MAQGGVCADSRKAEKVERNWDTALYLFGLELQFKVWVKKCKLKVRSSANILREDS